MRHIPKSTWRTLFAVVSLMGVCAFTLRTVADDAKPARPAENKTAKPAEKGAKPADKPDSKTEKKGGDAKDDAPDAAPVKEPKPLWSTGDGFDHPESAYFDFRSGTLFVSQVGGDADKKDKNGFISKLDANGKVHALKWVTGLNAPKGMHTYKGKLWVSDIDELIGIDIASAKIVDRIPAEGAKFLNDVACDADGAVYVSDTLGSRIYVYQDKKMKIFAEGPELESPNGLLVHDELLIVAGWGLTTDFTTKTPGRLFALHVQSKTKELITPEPVGNLDGVDFDGSGGYLVSDWVAGKVLQISVEGEVNTILSLTKGAADLSFDPAKQIVIVPRMLDNKVCAYTIPIFAE